MFTGHEHDSTADLTYAKQRYYDQDVGKFMSIDPVVLNLSTDKRLEQVLQDPQLQNSYSYTRNNTLNLTDPDGEFAFLIPIIAALTTPLTFTQAVLTTVSIYGALDLGIDVYNLDTTFRKNPASSEAEKSKAIGEVVIDTVTTIVPGASIPSAILDTIDTYSNIDYGSAENSSKEGLNSVDNDS